MPTYTTKIIRHDRLSPPPKDVSALPVVIENLSFLNKNRNLLLAYVKGKLKEQNMMSLENTLNKQLFHLSLKTIPHQRRETIKQIIHNYVQYDAYKRFVNSDPDELIKRHSCLVRQLIESAQRELLDLDEYLYHIDHETHGWSISEHMYDRLIGPNLFKLNRSRFFTSPYLNGQERQALPGCLAGPLSTTLITVLLASTFSGAITPCIFIGFCCLPSIAYLINGIKWLKNATYLALCDDSASEKSLHIKINLQKALSCCFIALIIPFAWPMTFPLELVRFITRSISTIIELTKSSVSESLTFNFI